jgi:hypothetical protein
LAATAPGTSSAARRVARRGLRVARRGGARLDSYLTLLRDRIDLQPNGRVPRARLSETEATVADLQRQLVRARADAGDLNLTGGRTVDDLGFVFIVAYGRSGSTLLQGILNSIPGYDIHGENHDALHHLFGYHYALDTARAKNTRATELPTESSWYGIDRYDRTQALRAMRRLFVQTVLRPRPDTRVVGFKEIRWMHRDWEPYLDFLRELFPGARFVINSRSHESVAQSKWWVESKNPLGELKRCEARLEAMADRLGEAAYPVRYDDYVADPNSLTGLFGWLGETLDLGRVAAVMAKRHSY